MAESLTKQDEKNPVIWLTTRLRSSHTGRTRKIFFGHIIKPLLTKVVRSRWPPTYTPETVLIFKQKLKSGENKHLQLKLYIFA